MIKSIVKNLFATGPGVRLRGRLAGGNLAVLTYHRINDGEPLFHGLPLESFAAQMEWLSENVRLLRATDLATELFAQDTRELGVLVTFDDGYRDFATRAYPVLRHYNVPALMFLPTQLIDEGGLVWTDRVSAAVGLTERSHFREPWPGGETVALDTLSARSALIERAKRVMKRSRDSDRRKWEGILLAELGVEEAIASLPRQMLTWDEVRSMRDLVDFGGHSHSHPIMSQLPAQDFVRELQVSRDRLVAELGSHPRWFAYPNGTRLDIRDDAGSVLEELGYEAAFTTIPGVNRSGHVDRWCIRRQPTDGSTVADFAWLIASAGDR